MIPILFVTLLEFYNDGTNYRRWHVVDNLDVLVYNDADAEFDVGGMHICCESIVIFCTAYGYLYMSHVMYAF